MKSAIEIANSARLLPITEVAAAAGILPEELVPFGLDRGKVKLSILRSAGRRARRQAGHRHGDHADQGR